MNHINQPNGPNPLFRTLAVSSWPHRPTDPAALGVPTKTRKRPSKTLTEEASPSDWVDGWTRITRMVKQISN